MSSSLIQLLVLAGIAVFLIVKLRSVLGTREGFEKPPIPLDDIRPATKPRRDFEVIEGGPDRDIIDHVADGSAAAKALATLCRPSRLSWVRRLPSGPVSTKFGQPRWS